MGNQARRPAGTPTGGEFAATGHDEAGIDLNESDRTWLTSHRVLGYHYAEENSEIRTCDQCGQAIRHIITTVDDDTGKTAHLGMDCAGRVGLSRTQIREMHDAHFAGLRAAKSRAEQARIEAELEREEAEAEAAHGPHGTESRYDWGCRCDDCLPAAPHGTEDRLLSGKCLCQDCIDAALADEHTYSQVSIRVLLDAHTGHPIPEARYVRTRYGGRWAVDRPDGTTDWFPVGPKRRSTSANKGVLEAEVPVLSRATRSGNDWHVAIIGAPPEDAWGEPLDVDGDPDEVFRRFL